MDREQLVVVLLRQELEAGAGELRAHEDGDDPCRDEEDERRCDVEHTDLLVVGGGEPVEQPGRLFRGATFGDRGHVAAPCRDAHCRNAAGDRAFTRKVMSAWLSPQNSAHSPKYVPV